MRQIDGSRRQFAVAAVGTYLLMVLLFWFWPGTHPYALSAPGNNERFGVNWTNGSIMMNRIEIDGYTFFFEVSCKAKGLNATQTCAGWTDQNKTIWIVGGYSSWEIYKICIHEIAHNEIQMDYQTNFPNSPEEVLIINRVDSRDIYDSTCKRLIQELGGD